MSTSTVFPLRQRDKNQVNNKQILELIDYLFSLKEKNFTGQLAIDFRGGAVNQVAFNQKAFNGMESSANKV